MLSKNGGSEKKIQRGRQFDLIGRWDCLEKVGELAEGEGGGIKPSPPYR